MGMSVVAVAELAILGAADVYGQVRYRGRHHGDASDRSHQEDCTVRKGPGGLIRGDQISQGCVLRQEGEPVIIVYAVDEGGDLSDATLAGINSTATSKGRFESFNRHFGPIERNFGRSAGSPPSSINASRAARKQP